MNVNRARYRLYTSLGSYLPVGIRQAKASDENRLVEKLRKFLGVQNVAISPMCRTSIYLLIKHMTHPGAEVIMSPYTIADVVNMVISAGAKPVFADIDERSCNVTLENIQSKISDNTGAVLVTHLHGIPADIEQIAEFCKDRDIFCIEDAAQAFGVKTLVGNRLGTIADAGAYSFGTYKNINGWYGGALVCKDQHVFKLICEEISQYPLQRTDFVLKRMVNGILTNVATLPPIFKSFTFWVFRFGHLHNIRAINKFVETELDLQRYDTLKPETKGRMTSFQMRLAADKISDIDRDEEIRRNNATYFHKNLSGISQLTLPHDKYLTNGGFTYYPIQADDRLTLLRHLTRHGCDIGPQHLKNCADLPAFDEFKSECEVARKMANSVILLPTYPGYDRKSMDHTIATIKSYFAEPVGEKY